MISYKEKYHKEDTEVKRLICLIVCVLLPLTMAVTAAAEETNQNLLRSESQICVHSVSAWQSAGDTSHTGVCTLCGETQTENHSWGEPTGTDAACTAEGMKTYTCSRCPATKTETISATGHSFGSWTYVDGINHKRVCPVCNAEETVAHSQSTETVTQAATCTEEGKKDLICVCGHIISKDVAIPRIDHAYGTWTADAATHSRSCTECSDVDSKNHKFDKVTVVKAATCKDAGELTKTCSTCGYTSVPESIAKLTTHTYDNSCDDTCNVCEEKRDAGHKFSSVWSKNGIGHWYTCTVCGEKKDENKHIPGPAATEEKEQVCLTCAYVMMPKKNHVHDYEKTWSTDDAGHWYACTGCDGQKSFAVHSYDDACDTECNDCGYKNEAAHEFAYSTSTAKNHQAVCAVCGEKKTAEEHVPGPEATEKEPQLCTICGYILAPVLDHTHAFGTTWRNNGQSHWQECECGEQSIPEAHTWDGGVEEKDDKICFTCTLCALERTEEQGSSGFPWWILFTVLGLVLVGGVGVLFYILKMSKQTGKYAK